MSGYNLAVSGRYLIRRGFDQVLSAVITQGGAQIVPTSAIVSVRRPTGAYLYELQVASIAVDGTVSYTVQGIDTSSLPLEQGWLVVWQIDLPDGSTREYVVEGALVRYVLTPPATLADLYSRVARLDPSHSSPLTRDMDLGDKLEDAWLEIEERLYAAGRRPELVMSPGQFRRLHRELTLALIYEDLRTSSYESYDEMAREYRRSYEAAWSRLVFSYDADQDGLVDGGAVPERESGSPTVWLSGRGVGWIW